MFPVPALGSEVPGAKDVAIPGQCSQKLNCVEPPTLNLDPIYVLPPVVRTSKNTITTNKVRLVEEIQLPRNTLD